MNQSQIIASVVRAATWQLARISSTWLLLGDDAGAFLFVGPH